ncbi:MAG TPA: hypothetical protein DD473_18115 [Planctomycetaceae bacterium]|nr:hypothetical protein [Planctomycetaceae bacterium]
MLAHYQFTYGNDQTFSFELNESLVRWAQTGPATNSDISAAIQAALSDPLDYPPVHEAVVPGDRVAIVVDPETPSWPEIVCAIGSQLEKRGVEPGSLRISLNTEVESNNQAGVSKVPYAIVPHEQVMEGRAVYLASTAEGERIYLPEEIGEADYIISIGRFGFDDHWGYRGTHSIVFPAFATEEEKAKYLGKGHQELSPEDSRGVRQVIDEIGWLLGLQYCVQVIPSGSGELSHVLSGACDSVFQKSVSLLNDAWRSTIPTRAETVIVSIPHANEVDAWAATARACRVAEKLTTDDGRVIIMTDLQKFPEDLHRQFEASADAGQVLRALNRSPYPQARAVAALASLANRFKVYLRSNLEQDVVESLFCIPLADEEELRNALQGGESYALLQGGQFAYVDSAN